MTRHEPKQNAHGNVNIHLDNTELGSVALRALMHAESGRMQRSAQGGICDHAPPFQRHPLKLKVCIHPWIK